MRPMTAAIALDIDQCAHCGLVIADDQFLLVYCGQCGFEYCSDHAEAAEHDCTTICADSEAFLQDLSAEQQAIRRAAIPAGPL